MKPWYLKDALKVVLSGAIVGKLVHSILILPKLTIKSNKFHFLDSIIDCITDSINKHYVRERMMSSVIASLLVSLYTATAIYKRATTKIK